MGIPLNGSLLLVLIAKARWFTIGRAKRRTTSHPVGLVSHQGRRVWPDGSDGACVSAYGAGADWHGAFP